MPITTSRDVSHPACWIAVVPASAVATTRRRPTVRDMIRRVQAVDCLPDIERYASLRSTSTLARS